MSISEKINDLSNSSLRKKFFSDEFVPENNLAIRSIRVSSKKQERGKSIEEQQEITEEYSKKERLSIQKTWEVAETASKHEMRKHFHQMLEYIRASQHTPKPIKHVIFSFQSRSSRNRKSSRELEELVELGVTLHFARDRRKLTCKSDLSELMLWHMENFKNESFISDLTKNSMGGTIKSIERGLYPSGRPLFGYQSVGRKDRRHFILDGDRAEYMKAAFEIVGSTIFSEEKLSDKKLKDKLDRMFPQLKKTPNKKQFCELLRNPFYTGEEFIYGGTTYKADPALQPAIVSRANWLRVQDILAGRHKGRKLSIAHPYIGLMNCNGLLLDEAGNLTDEICGHAITAEQIRKKYKNGTSQDFNYYRCSDQTGRCSQRDRRYMKEVAKHNVSYSQEEVEVIFQDMFKSFSFDEVTCQRMKQYLWKEHFEEKEKHSVKLDELQARQVELKIFIEKSYEDKLKGLIHEEMWRKQNQQWEREHAKIVGELDALKNSTDEYMQRGVTLIELMQHSEIIFKKATPEIKRKMVELVSSNLLLKDGTLQYHWRKPFNMLAVRGDFEIWRSHGDSNPGYRRERAVS